MQTLREDIISDIIKIFLYAPTGSGRLTSREDPGSGLQDLITTSQDIQKLRAPITNAMVNCNNRDLRAAARALRRAWETIDRSI